MKYLKKALVLCISLALLLSVCPLALAADSAAFTDIGGSSHASAIQVLAEGGILKGVGGGKFDPDGSLDRAAAATVLHRLAGTPTPKADSKFEDVEAGTWYTAAVNWASENGIVLGYGDGKFGPKDPVTGGQLELMLSRYAKLIGVDYPVRNTSGSPLTRGEMAEMVYSLYVLDSSTTRETTNGPVRGFIAGNGANVWRGIPYAKADRWEAPTDPEPWTGALACGSYGPVAIQYGMNYATFQNETKGLEDCLNLDVYAPEGAKDLPVLVYVHGGNNQTGQTDEIPGTDLVITNNCVYVSINYRLGLFGFNCLPALQDEGETGNYGLLDIAKALDWVKANAASFGGDPDNITISGFSAGGRDVMAMLISPLFKDKFDKAIVFSGGMTVADVDKSAVQIAYAVAPLAVEDGKADNEAAAAKWLLTDSAEVAAYLKSLDANRLVPLMGNAGIRMSVFPHLFADGVAIPKEGFETTQYNSVPVIMLTGSGEFSLFNGLADSLSGADAATQDAAKAFSLKYGSDMYRIFNAQVSADNMFDSYDAPIYVCQVDYEADGRAFSGNYPMGAFHGIFVPMLSSVHGYAGFDSTNYQNPGYRAMAGKFNAYLTSFLASGEPKAEGLNEWTKWDPATKLSMVFDADKSAASAEMKNVSKSFEDIIAEMVADDTVTDEVKNAQIANVTNGRWFSYVQDEYFDLPSLWIADQFVVAGTQQVVVEGFDWGPAVTKTVIALDTEVDASTVSADAFSVTENKQGFDWATFSPAVTSAPRAVTAAYASDAKGSKAAGNSKYITLELAYDPDTGSPYFYDFIGTGMNRYADPYNLTITLTSSSKLAAGGKVIDKLCVGKVDIAKSLTPQLEGIDLTGTFTGTDGKTLGYAFYTPANAADGQKHPLVIWLHGMGEGGTDPSVAVLGNKVTALYGEEFQKIMGGAYVLAPQTPGFWLRYDENDPSKWGDNPGVKSIYTETLMELIESYVAANPAIDTDRIIIGGCSNGGYMTMNMVIEYPDYFAAAYPICEAYMYAPTAGVENSGFTAEKLAAIKDLPIWFVWSQDDTTVIPDTYEVPTVAALREAGAANLHTSVFEHVVDTTGQYKGADGNPYQYMGHWSWLYFFNNQCTDNGVNMWEWMAQQSK